MEIEIDFPGGKRVDAILGGHIIRTDQPSGYGGDDSAPAPFDLFLASMATCAGIFVLSFCQKRGLSTEDIRMVQRVERSRETGMISLVKVEISLPPEFPEKYRKAVVRAAEQCAVVKHLENPPVVEVAAAYRST